MLDAIHRIQESEYHFPYHYISRYPSQGFQQHFVDYWGINYISTIEFHIEEIGHLKPQSIADVGCGDGRMAREVSKRTTASRVLGIDYSHQAIALARALNMDATDEGLHFQVFDITQERLDERFDLVILMEVLEHIPPDECSDFLAGVRSLIGTGGKLFLTVPHSNKPLEDKHYQHFSVDSLLKLMEVNFVVERVVPFERKTRFRRLFNALLANRYFVLNNPKLLQYLYGFYARHLFHCRGESNCQRIFIEAIGR